MVVKEIAESKLVFPFPKTVLLVLLIKLHLVISRKKQDDNSTFDWYFISNGIRIYSVVLEFV